MKLSHGFYKTRSGRKVHILGEITEAVPFYKDATWVGYIVSDYANAFYWKPCGQIGSIDAGESVYDLVSEWKEPLRKKVFLVQSNIEPRTTAFVSDPSRTFEYWITLGSAWVEEGIWAEPEDKPQ